MKKKVLAVAVFAAMAVIGALAFNANVKEAKADINPNCPNGCVAGTGTCYCNGQHPYPEAKHKQKELSVAQQ